MKYGVVREEMKKMAERRKKIFLWSDPFGGRKFEVGKR